MDFLEDNLDTPLRDVLPTMRSRIKGQTHWMGVMALKCPLDSWMYQELVFDTKPDAIVEVGVHTGGGLLFLAHMCDLIGHGRVIGIDCDMERVHPKARTHPRVSLIKDDAVHAADEVEDMLGGMRGMVVEDSSHTFDNTLAVLRAYSRFVAPGCYFVVEDGICGHGLDSGPRPGPYEAIEAFMDGNDDFETDRSREWVVTWNPKGYLRRKP